MERKQATLSTGIKASYLEAGQGGPHLVLLHGITDAAMSYSPYMADLAKTHHVYALDFRGHGDSDRSDQPYMMDGYVDDTIAFIREVVGEGPIVLAGHSLGSMVTAHIAGQNAVPLKGAFLEDPPLYQADAEVLGESEIVKAFALLQMLMVQHHANKGTTEQLVEIFRQVATLGDPTKTNGDVMSAAQILQWVQIMEKFDPKVLDGLVAHTGINFLKADDYLPNITCPVHILAGNDALGAVITMAELERAAGAIANCTTSRMEHLGHLIHQMDQAAYMRELQGFLARV